MASGNRLSIARFLGLVGEAQARAGALDKARSTIEEALNAAPDQLVDLPYALWLRGELLVGGLNPVDDTEFRLTVGSPVYEQAAQSFSDSMLIANRIGAKSYLLRAATSPARLQKRAGRRNADDTINPILSDFVEGFDTRDLLEAKAEMKPEEQVIPFDELDLQKTVDVNTNRGFRFMLRNEPFEQYVRDHPEGPPATLKPQSQ